MNDKLNALILSINKALGWVQITTHGCNYTCPIKEVDGKLLFKFKNAWHIVDDFVGDTTRLVLKGEHGLIEKIYKK